MAMEGERQEEAVGFPRGWDCGSQLYDSVELASVYRALDGHLAVVAPPGPGRRAAPAPGKTKTGCRRRRRTGKAVLHSIFRSITCSRKL